MRRTVFSLLFLSAPAFALDVAQYACTINGVYENRSGVLVQRPDDKAIGQQLYVNADTGEVTGYFGTDGFQVTKVKRPDGDGLLTIETAHGVSGDAANRLSVSPADEKTKKHNFIYTKNWLVVSGQCSAVVRH